MSRFWQAVLLTAGAMVLLVLYLQDILFALNAPGCAASDAPGCVPWSTSPKLSYKSLEFFSAPNLLGMALAFIAPVWMVFKWPLAMRPAAILLALSLALYIAFPVLRVI